jgi:hypothetical protein
MKETTGLTGRPAADGAPTLPPGGLLPVDAIDAIAKHVDGTFVLVVKTYRRPIPQTLLPLRGQR